MPAPTETPVKTNVPGPETERPVKEDPDRFYWPERLCPDQTQKSTWRSLP
jgi:hypothetical protein